MDEAKRETVRNVTHLPAVLLSGVEDDGDTENIETVKLSSKTHRKIEM